jgi:hypothetical protein
MAGLAAVTLAAAPKPAAAQNPEMRARICENLDRKSVEESWPDRSTNYDEYTGDYDDPARERSSRDWRVERICDGRYIWARALFGDVAPFPLMPTDEPNHFADYRGNQWVFTRSPDGAVRHLDWIWQSGESFRLVPVE